MLCQWFAGVRTMTPRLVGSAGGMSYRRFALAQVPSAVLWVCTWMSVGAVAGATYERVATRVSVVGLVVLAVVLLAVSVWATVLRRRFPPTASSGGRRRGGQRGQTRLTTGDPVTGAGCGEMEPDPAARGKG